MLLLAGGLKSHHKELAMYTTKSVINCAVSVF